MDGFVFSYHPPLPAAPDPGRAKKDFSTIGFALLAFLTLSTALQLAVSYLLLPRVPYSPLMTWGVAYILPLYGVGVPAALLLMRGVPAERAEKRTLGAKEFWGYLLICFPIMYGGNMVGSLMSYMFSAGTAENQLLDVVMDSSPLQVLVLAVLAPLFEEFIFRRQLIDRLGRYGEKTAIFFSALAFGLFHGNLYQFFYAFGLGLLFAYLYTRTRRLRYSVILHACVNFLGSVVAPWILQRSDLSVVEEILAGSLDVDLSGVLPLYAYSLLLFGLSIAGLVVLIRRIKKILLLPTAEQLPRGSAFRIACLNPGFLVFTLVCFSLFVTSLFA